MRTTRLTWDGNDASGLATTLRALAPALEEVAPEVAATIADVAARGDAAVRELDARHGTAAESLRVGPAQIEAALAALDAEVADAMQIAAANVRAVAVAQTGPPDASVELPQGQTISVGETPVRSAGAYVPGGRAPYPSTVLMCCVPARVAGVERIVVASPPQSDGSIHSTVLAACAVAGADEVYAIGGAQAIAALALGTESIAPVDVVVGPGNRYVQEAKVQLAGRVGIDGVAGPTELMVAFDRGVELDWMALDLCAQAEHGDDGLLVAAAADGALLEELEARIATLVEGRPSVFEPALALVELARIGDAIPLADALAPEHLQLAFAGAEGLAAGVRTAGCVFVGPGAGAAFGDYAAGSNHVLPTGGAGRFTGPLSPATFRRRRAVVSLPARAAAALAPQVAAIARAEGFPVHAESAEARR